MYANNGRTSPICRIALEQTSLGSDNNRAGRMSNIEQFRRFLEGMIRLKVTFRAVMG